MRQFVARFVKEEDGLSTAEYAVGTVVHARRYTTLESLPGGMNPEH